MVLRALPKGLLVLDLSIVLLVLTPAWSAALVGPAASVACVGAVLGTTRLALQLLLLRVLQHVDLNLHLAENIHQLEDGCVPLLCLVQQILIVRGLLKARLDSIERVAVLLQLELLLGLENEQLV